MEKMAGARLGRTLNAPLRKMDLIENKGTMMNSWRTK